MTDRLVRREREDGYRGVWFTLGQTDGAYGDKYSGGLATYTMKHVPTAVHDAAVDRTFFTYGAAGDSPRDLRVAVGAYDHETGHVARPTLVDEKPEPDATYGTATVGDPHDNASCVLGPDGRLWVFVAGRARRRGGRVYRAVEPHDTTAFELVAERILFGYPQPWALDDCLLVLYTRYTEAGDRELYRTTLDTGGMWGQSTKIVGFGGHYQVSEQMGDGVVTAFNWHPDGNVDRRTNLYILATDDGGDTWQTMAGQTIQTPVAVRDNPALVVDYADRGRLVYLKDVAVDDDGNPAVLYLTSDGHPPGPDGAPRRLRVTRWTGTDWTTATVGTCTHNYDAGCLYPGDPWRVVAPTDPGPQRWGTGGEVVVYRRGDDGWKRERALTADSERNHTYVRRPRNAVSPFEALWADGNTRRESASRLYMASQDGTAAWQLPDQMDNRWESPRKV
jgi:hypothetical protein